MKGNWDEIFYFKLSFYYDSVRESLLWQDVTSGHMLLRGIVLGVYARKVTGEELYLTVLQLHFAVTHITLSGWKLYLDKVCREKHKADLLMFYKKRFCNSFTRAMSSI